MSVRHFCTYFDHNYLPRAVVMLESLHEHCPHAHVHVLCLSEQCYDALTAFAYPHVSLIRLDELEAADPHWLPRAQRAVLLNTTSPLRPVFRGSFWRRISASKRLPILMQI